MICRCLIQAAPSSMFTHGRRKEATEKCDHNGGLVQLLLNDFNPLAASRQILCITGKKCRYGARLKRILNAATNDCTERRFLVDMRDENSKWGGRHCGSLPPRGGNGGELILTPHVGPASSKLKRNGVTASDSRQRWQYPAPQQRPAQVPAWRAPAHPPASVFRRSLGSERCRVMV